MPENPIYEFLKANKLTDKDEATFLKEYSDSSKAKELYGFFQANNLTDKDFNGFYDTYLKKKETASPLGGKVGNFAGRLDVGTWGSESVDEGKPIGKALGKVSGITTPEQAKISRVNKAFGKIESFAGSREDFEEIYKQAPQEFDNLAKQVAPNVNKGEIDKFYTTEAARKDAYVDRVLQSYNQQKTKAQLEAARQNREKIDAGLGMPFSILSNYTGKQYQLPQSEAQVSEILSDLNNEKEKLKTELTTNWNLSEVQIKAKELSEIEAAIRQNLTYQVGRMAFERLSQNNPNVTSKDIGKEIFRVLHPDEYDLYEKIGGDKPVSFTVGTQRDTPVEADALNEQMVKLGNEIKRMYGNETAIQDADIEEQTAKRKYTFQRQAQVKQKIAAILHERGLSPDKATEELKDKVVNKYLPDEDKEIWYNNNKIYNDVDLPSTGFAYSLKNAYYDTVKDAVGTVFGGLMPNRKKMRAAELLEGMSTSDVLGEDPQFKARLSQLKEKEKTQQLNDQEKQEKEQLEQFTDLRSKKQKIFDMAGSGVGQILGLGSISAFTGGLSSARTGLGALKSLVAPSGGRGGIMAASYLMSHENNAKEALRMFPNEKDALKRFFSTEFNTAIDMAVEQIFPEEQFLSGIAKKEVSKLITNLTAKNIASTLNDNAFKQLAKNIVGRSKKLLATPLQETAEEEIALSLKKTFEGIIAPDKSEGLTLKDVVETGEQAFWGSVLLGAPKGVLGYTNNKVPLTALWDAASSQDGYTKTKMTIERLKRDGELTEAEAKDRLDNLELGRNEYLNNPILSGDMGGLDAGQKQNYFARLLNEAILKKQAQSLIDPTNINKQIKESEAIREKIYKGEIKVTPENEELTKQEFEKKQKEQPTIDQDRVLGDEEVELTPEQKIIQQAIDNNEVEGMFLDMAKAAAADPQQAKQLLDEAKSQATGQVAGELGSARSGVEKAWGKTIADFVAPQAEAGSGGVGLSDKARTERREKYSDIINANGSTFWNDIKLENAKIGDEFRYEEYKDGQWIKHKTKVKDIVDGEVMFENGQTQKNISSYMNITAEDMWFAKNIPEAGSGGVGDVLKDVESTAKALEGADLNKMPNVSWHGSKNRDLIFGQPKEGKVSKSNMQLDFGTHFTSEDYASFYEGDKGKKYPAIIDLKSPLDLTQGMWWKDDANFEKVHQLIKDLKLEKSYGSIDFVDKDGNRQPDIQGVSINAHKLSDISPKKVSDALKKNGFDGIIYEPYHPAGGSGGMKFIEAKPKSFVVLNNSSIKEVNHKNISEAYHKAKADGSNPELVKAVEDLLLPKAQPKAETPTQETTPVSEPTTPLSTSGIKKSNRGVVKKARGIEDLTEPRDIVMQYFAGGNKINPSAIKELFGGKDERLHFGKGTGGEQKSKISLLKGDAPSIKELAHKLWEASGGLEDDYRYTDRDFRDAIESVLQDHNSPTSMSIELVDKYINKAVKQELTDQEAKDISDGLIRDITKYVEELPENQQNELVKLLSKYQDKFGFIDWDAVEKDSNGFDPDILSLTIETQEALDGIIQKNLKSGQGELSDASRQGSRQEKGEEKVIPQKKPEEPTTPPTTQPKSEGNKVDEGMVSELEAERDAEILKQGKPKVDIVGLKDEEFAKLSATKQNEYEEWEKEEINLRKLIDCLWKK